jgi:hypothetical protein
MSQSSYALLAEHTKTTSIMQALVFRGPGKIQLESAAIPKAWPCRAAFRN